MIDSTTFPDKATGIHPIRMVRPVMPTSKPDIFLSVSFSFSQKADRIMAKRGVVAFRMALMDALRWVTEKLMSADANEHQKIYNRWVFSLKLLLTTLTELRAIAAPAIMGSSINPLIGYSMPAAMGMPMIL